MAVAMSISQDDLDVRTKQEEVAVNFALSSGWATIGHQHQREEPVSRLKAAEMTMVGELHERREKLRQQFYSWDTDGSGSITREELAHIFAKLGKMDRNDIDSLMDAADTNGNGMIEVEEFVNWLSKASSEHVTIVNYGEALKPVFDAFDRSRNGVITFDEFCECHGILQGALRLNPEEDEETQNQIDPLMLRKDADRAFYAADKQGDGNLSFGDFAAYMHELVVQSGVSMDDLRALLDQLAAALRDVFEGIRMAEDGLIDEKDVFILGNKVSHLSNVVRNLQHAKAGSVQEAPQCTSILEWVDPPPGFSLQSLKTMHMKCTPVNIRIVQAFEFEITCVPLVTALAPDGSPELRPWIGEVCRRIQYKNSKTTRREQYTYYRFDVAKKCWECLDTEGGSQQLLLSLTSIAPEIGMNFIVHSSAQSWGDELEWSCISRFMKQCVDIGWISVDQRLKHKTYMLAWAQQKLPADYASQGPACSRGHQLQATNVRESSRLHPCDKCGREFRLDESARQCEGCNFIVCMDCYAVAEARKAGSDPAFYYLSTQMRLRPRILMATLSKCGIAEKNDSWKNYMSMVPD